MGVLPATGSVATSGRWSASATLAEDEIPLYAVVPVALKDAATAEVHLVVRSHGPASNFTADQLVEALTTIGGGCEINTCGDAQDSIFLPPQPQEVVPAREGPLHWRGSLACGSRVLPRPSRPAQRPIPCFGHGATRQRTVGSHPGGAVSDDSDR